MAYSACINISTYTNMDTFMYYTYSVDTQSVPSTCLYVYSCLYYIYTYIHIYIYILYTYMYILLVLFLCYILYKFAHNFQFAVAHDSGVAGRPPEGPFQRRSHAVVVSWWSGILTIWIKLDPLGSVEFWLNMTYDIHIWMKYEMTIWMTYSIGQMNMTYEWNWMNQASRRALKPPTSPAGWIWKMLGQRWSNLWLVVSTLKNLWPFWIIILCKIY